MVVLDSEGTLCSHVEAFVGVAALSPCRMDTGLVVGQHQPVLLLEEARCCRRCPGRPKGQQGLQAGQEGPIAAANLCDAIHESRFRCTLSFAPSATAAAQDQLCAYAQPAKAKSVIQVGVPSMYVRWVGVEQYIANAVDGAQ